MLSKLALKMLDISIETSIVILTLIILLPFFKKRYAAKLTYYIWLVVVIRLLIPFSFALPVNLASYVDPVPDIVIHNNSQDLSYNSIEPEIIEYSRKNTDNNVNDTVTTSISTKKGTSTKIIDINRHSYYLPVIWLLGMGLYISYQFYNYKKYYKLIDKWSSVCNETTQNIVNSVILELKISGKIKVIQCKLVTSPMVMGFKRPRLVLPVFNYNENDLINIVKHELTHLKRNDIWFKLLLQIVIAVHWYNPMILFMKNQALKSIELSCDEDVTKGLDINSRKQYSYTILNSIIKKQQNLSALTTYFNNSNITVKERIENVMDKTKKRKGIIAFTVVLICIALTGSILIFGDNNSKVSGMFIESTDANEVFLDYIAKLEDDSLAKHYNSIDNGSQMIFTVRSINKREFLTVYLEQYENSENERVWSVKKHKYVKPENEAMFVSEAWAESVKSHDSKARYNLLSEELKKQYDRQVNVANHRIVTPLSTVEKYEIFFTDYGCTINYFLTDLVPSYYNSQDKLSFIKENKKLVITSINDKKEVIKPIETQVQSRSEVTGFFEKQDQYAFANAFMECSLMNKLEVENIERYNQVKDHLFALEYKGQKLNPAIPIQIMTKDINRLVDNYINSLLNGEYASLISYSNDKKFNQEGVEIWKSIKIKKVNIIEKDIRDNKACFKLDIIIEEPGKSIYSAPMITRWLYMQSIYHNSDNQQWYIAGLMNSTPSDEWWKTK